MVPEPVIVLDAVWDPVCVIVGLDVSVPTTRLLLGLPDPDPVIVIVLDAVLLGVAVIVLVPVPELEPDLEAVLDEVIVLEPVLLGVP